MGAGGVAAGSLGASTLIGFAAASQDARAIKREAAFANQQAEFNARLLEVQKEELAKSAQDDIKQREELTRRLVGDQRAALAAQGIEIDSDLGLALQEETELIGAEDVLTIKNNAWRQALGIDIEIAQVQARGQFGLLKGDRAANATLVTAGLGAATNIGTFAASRAGRTNQPRPRRSTTT